MHLRGLLAGGLALLAVGGCGGSAKRAICPPAERALLLRAQLQPLRPSPAFRVAASDTVWMQTTRAPVSYDQSQPFGRTGIEVHLMAAQAHPDPQRDHSVVMRQPRRWVTVDLTPGAWRLYALRDPAVAVVACRDRSPGS